MNEFGFLNSTLTVFYQTGLDEFNEPVIKVPRSVTWNEMRQLSSFILLPLQSSA